MKEIVYDIEIAKAIADRGSPRIDGIEYCDGWQDHANMGISSIVALQRWDYRYRIFMNDNLGEFARLVEEADRIVGFNSIPFDNAVCRANGVDVPDEKSYDILREVWIAAGLTPAFSYPSHIGFSLDALSAVNLGRKKTGHGALAPVQFQRGEYGSLLDYNMNDVWLTDRLYSIVKSGQGLDDPRSPGKLLPVRVPA